MLRKATIHARMFSVYRSPHVFRMIYTDLDWRLALLYKENSWLGCAVWYEIEIYTAYGTDI